MKTLLPPLLGLLLHLAQAVLDGYSEEKLGLQLLKHKILNDPEALAVIEDKRRAIVSLYKAFPFMEARFPDFVDAQRRRDSLEFVLIRTDSAQANCTYVKACFEPSSIRVNVDIVPQPDTDELNGPRRVMISSSTAVSASDRNGWLRDRSEETADDLTTGMSASAATLGGLVAWQASAFQTVHGMRRWGSSENGENGLEQRRETTISSEIPCPEHHLCQGVTWSYVVEISGPVILIPTLDSQCLADALEKRKQWPCGWCAPGRQLLDQIQEQGLRSNMNISYAALPRSRFGDPWFKENPIRPSEAFERCELSDEFYEFSEEAPSQPRYLHQGIVMPPPGLVTRYRYETPKRFGHTLRYPSGRMWSTSFLLKSRLQAAHSQGFPSKAKAEDPVTESCELESGWSYAPQIHGACLLPPPGQRKQRNDGWECHAELAEPDAFSEKCPNVKRPPLLKALAWNETKGWCLLEKDWQFTIDSGTQWFRPPMNERKPENRGWESHPTWPEPENVRTLCAELNKRHTRGTLELESPVIPGLHRSELIRDDTPNISNWTTAEMHGVFAEPRN